MGSTAGQASCDQKKSPLYLGVHFKKQLSRLQIRGFILRGKHDEDHALKLYTP